MLRVLVGCERFGRVRDAFIRLGHDAVSCDLEPTASPGPHIQADILDVIEWDCWDLAIFHPECRYLANSGALRLYLNGKKSNGRDLDRWSKMEQAALFFKRLLNSRIPKIAIENPIMHGYALSIIGERPAQYIQPWQFGDDASKATCIWLKGLPKLVPTNVLPGGRTARRANQTPSGQNKLGPSPERAIERAKTYLGIADAFAAQWGGKA